MTASATSVRARLARSRELIGARIEPAMTDSSVYLGTVIWEGAEVLLQRISPKRGIVHTKGMLGEVPRLGQKVRIVYNNGLATISRIALARQSRGFER
jgi:hypothetical protein